MASRSDPIEAEFFSDRNRQLLQKALTDDFGRRGVQMNQQLQTRLSKTLQHYIEEVYEVNGSQPLNYLNKEVVAATVQDFASYTRRQTVDSINIAQTQSPQLPSAASQIPRYLTEDTGSAFERMQSERVDARPMPKNIPDFRVSLEDDANVSALSLFEQAQKQREEEAAMQAAIQAGASSSVQQGNRQMSRFINATDTFASGFSQKNAAVESALVERNVNRLVNNLPSFPVLPQELMPLSTPLPTANPTIALPDAVRTREVLPQDNIIKQQDVLSYKETEHNLFINSADRDWVNNKNDTRYQFTVNFNPANNRQGFGLSPAAQVRFKNISRIELVKSIIPAEGLDILVRRKAANVVDTNNTDAVINALSFPYISVNIDELDNNNYGTNNVIDNTFGVLQYDANWVAESVDLKNDLTLSRGYLAMIPKFMKSQKVYTPTPLASLQRLTINFQRPDGTVLSSFPDTLNIAGIIPSERLSGTTTLFGSGSGTGSNVINTQAVYTTATGANSEYYWIQTSQWFSRHMFNEGDRINIGGLDLTGLNGNSNYNSGTVITGSATSELTNYFTQSPGLLISGIGYYVPVGTSNSFSSGGYQSNGVTTCANSLGYANCIIVQAKYNDPSTGSTAIRPFGGVTAVNLALGQALVGGSNGYLYTLSNARLINMSHQTQLVFRVITREMDSTSMIRPDNL